MFNPYAPKKFPTVKTVGDLKKVLAYFDDDIKVTVVESVYYGGREEYQTEEFGLVVQDYASELLLCSEHHAQVTYDPISSVINPDEL